MSGALAGNLWGSPTLAPYGLLGILYVLMRAGGELGRARAAFAGWFMCLAAGGRSFGSLADFDHGEQGFGGPDADHLAVELGVTRSFGLVDIADRGLHGGWSKSEEGHTWNDGLDANASLWITPMPESPCTLTIEGAPFLADTVNHQTLTLFGNGYRLGFWDVSDKRVQKLACLVEPEQWLRRIGGGLLKLVWHVPLSVRPVDTAGIPDHRRIGFCFRTLTLGV